MATPLPLTFRASPLPSNFRGTPQAFLDALVARLSIETQASLALFVSGASEPTSDVGPWLKNGVTWYVWDTTTGAYVPQPLEFESLKYVAQVSEPDPDIYVLWIKLNATTGKPESLQYYYGGAWVDIYADTFATFATITSVSEAIADINQYPARGTSSISQIVTGNSETVVALQETYDPSGVFDNSTYTAPADGYYHFDFKTSITLDSGTPTGIAIICQLLKNGAAMGGSDCFDAFDDETGGRTIGTGIDVQLAQGDTVQSNVQISSSGSSTWSINSSNSFLSGHKILSP
jgi:hypothetical protein